MKLKHLQDELNLKNLNLLLLFNTSLNKLDPNLAYLSQVSPEFCVLAIPKKGSAKLYVPGFEKQRIKKQSLIKQVIAIKKNSLLKQIKKDFRNPKRIAVNHNSLSVNEFKRLKKVFRAKFIDSSQLLNKLKSTKTDKELKIIKKSCFIASGILKSCIKNFKLFKTEADVKAFLETQTKKHNCTFSFPPIVASGKDSSLPHYTENKKLAKGFCVLDFGVKYKGYCSDITRTIYIGKPTNSEINHYNKVLETQIKCIEIIKKGIKTSKPYNLALKNLGKNFAHGLGHGLGIEIHELPNLKDKGKETFQPGMCFTIEPGLYLKNRYGIRIEDDFYINKKGEIKQLTNLPKKLICI